MPQQLSLPPYIYRPAQMYEILHKLCGMLQNGALESKNRNPDAPFDPDALKDTVPMGSMLMTSPLVKPGKSSAHLHQGYILFTEMSGQAVTASCYVDFDAPALKLRGNRFPGYLLSAQNESMVANVQSTPDSSEVESLFANLTTITPSIAKPYEENFATGHVFAQLKSYNRQDASYSDSGEWAIHFSYYDPVEERLQYLSPKTFAENFSLPENYSVSDPKEIAGIYQAVESLKTRE